MYMDFLQDKSLLTIFAFSPAGFGHLRVTDALNDGFPKNARHPLLLGSHDEVISSFHRFFSNNALGRRIFEWTQHGIAEDIFALVYRSVLHMRSETIYKQLLTVLDQRIDKPNLVLVVATHFALAHQIGKIKNKFEKEKGIKIVLVVQVTDDSPQHLWYIPEADLTFVPSENTKKTLSEYGKKSIFPDIKIEVNSYPISPVLGQLQKPDFCEAKVNQLNPSGKEKIHIMLPISGAAVGMDFFKIMIDRLHKKSPRFFFHIVARSTSYTQEFLNTMMQKQEYVDLHVGSSSRDAVNIYEEVYRQHTIALEITKPSEQSFKALLHPAQLGGSILLFWKPIGRQEYDNIAFLRRHHLIPLHYDTEYLWERSRKKLPLDEKNNGEIFLKASRWRGLKIPHEPDEAAEFIYYCFKNDLLSQMMNCKLPDATQTFNPEVNSNGVESFWKKVNILLKSAYGF